MHPFRTILAVIFGGFASLLLAHPIAESLRPSYPADAGLYAVLLAPVIAGALIGLTIAIAGGRQPAFTFEQKVGEASVHISGQGRSAPGAMRFTSDPIAFTLS